MEEDIICVRCLNTISDEELEEIGSTDEDICLDCLMDEWSKENKSLEREYYNSRL